MGRASQRHKLETRGYNSLGQRMGFATYLVQNGTDAIDAVVILTGLFGSGDTVTVLTDIGGGDVTSEYTPSGNEDANAAATGLAAIITGKSDHTATAAENTVRITKSTAGTVRIVSTAVL